jgi:uncharacterized membrane protein YukC
MTILETIGGISLIILAILVIRFRFFIYFGLIYWYEKIIKGRNPFM